MKSFVNATTGKPQVLLSRLFKMKQMMYAPFVTNTSQHTMMWSAWNALVATTVFTVTAYKGGVQRMRRKDLLRINAQIVGAITISLRCTRQLQLSSQGALQLGWGTFSIQQETFGTG